MEKVLQLNQKIKWASYFSNFLPNQDDGDFRVVYSATFFLHLSRCESDKDKKTNKCLPCLTAQSSLSSLLH